MKRRKIGKKKKRGILNWIKEHAKPWTYTPEAKGETYYGFGLSFKWPFKAKDAKDKATDSINKKESDV